MSSLSNTLYAALSHKAGRIAVWCAAAVLAAGYGVLGFALLSVLGAGDPWISMFLLIVWVGAALLVVTEVIDQVWFLRSKRWIEAHFDAVSSRMASGRL